MNSIEKLKSCGVSYVSLLTATLDASLLGTEKGVITLRCQTRTTYEDGKVKDFTITGISWQCAIITTDSLNALGLMHFVGDI